MADFLTAVGLVFVLEGCLYALLAPQLKRLVTLIQDTPEGQLRVTGIGAAVLGVLIVWLVRG